ncbi:MAG: efflux RND transporter periplasmic adaptor subunit [Calditrichia bacterium]|nr:efflux RND transporter periplasmic adaptor subunit [Calditrichia bacterium]
MNFLKSLILIMTLIFFVQFNYSCDGGSAQNEDSAGSDSTSTDSSNVEKKKDGKPDEENKEEVKADLIPVEVTTIKRGLMSDFILLSANLETEKMADIYSRVQGLVDNILAEEGDVVKKGQVLMTLEADEYVLAEEKARLNYLSQKSDFDRLEAMHKQDLLSIEEFEKAKYALQGLEVDWKQAKLNLSYTRITTPIAGVVGDRSRKQGDRIQPTDKLFTVINTSEMIAVVYAPEKELGNVVKKQSAYITSDHLAGEQYEGWIKRVSPVIDPQSGTFKITIGVKNKKNILRAGMFVNTHIITATHENAVLIPKTAIVYENEQMNVFVVKDSIANKVILKVGFQDHEKVESLEGIEEGDQIIVVGQAGLKDKTKVRIVNERKNDLALKIEK